MKNDVTRKFEIILEHLNEKKAIQLNLIALAKNDPIAPKNYISYKKQTINTYQILIESITEQINSIPSEQKQWLSVSNLVQTPEFPLKDIKSTRVFLNKNAEKLLKHLKENANTNTIVTKEKIAMFILQEKRDIITPWISATEFPLIHKDAIKHITDFTNSVLNDWLSPADLAQNKDLESYSIKNIKQFLDAIKKIMPDNIMELLPSECYLNKKALNDFIQYIHKGKTHEWLSISEIQQNYPEFNEYSKIEIYNLLTKWQKSASNDVEERQNIHNRNTPLLCLRATKIEDFIKYVSAPTQEQQNKTTDQPTKKTPQTKWLTAQDLSKAKSFPLTDEKVINKILILAQALMPNDIQFQKNKRGEISLCLRSTAKATLANMTELPPLPPKTSQWLSTTELRQLPNIQLNPQTIRSKLEMAQRLMPDDIRFFQTHSNTALCLCATKVNEFLKITNTENIPPKTSEWLSNVDLTKEPDLHIKSSQTIAQLLTDLHTDMPEYIQLRKPKTGIASLCIHKDAKNKFISIANTQKLRHTKEEQTDQDKQKQSDMQMDRVAWALAGKKVNNPEKANKLIFDMYEKLHYENY